MIKFIKIDKIRICDLYNLIMVEMNLILTLFKCKCILRISRKMFYNILSYV